ncbi:hypothetical protein [Ferruginibacter sp.]
MIEVFKTNINCPDKARELVEQLCKSFAQYQANFDLDDCDRILRVVNNNGSIAAAPLISWLKNRDCVAELLPDN